MGFFNSNKNRAANIAISRRGNIRSPQAQNRRIIKTMIQDNNTNNYKPVYIERVVTAKQAEAIDLGLTKWSLKYQDVMILLDPKDILPKEYIQNDKVVTNKVFNGIRCEKVGIVWSRKLKKFMYLAVNSNYTCYILFMDYLPNFDNIDLNRLPSSAEIIERVNWRMLSVFRYIHDLTVNPIFQMTSNEVFKK